MTVAATLVYADPNKLRYLLAYDGGADQTFTLTISGAATPDVLTDSLPGPIKKLAKVVTDGYGGFAAGVQTQAKARALWMSDLSGATPAPGEVGNTAQGVSCFALPLAIARVTSFPSTTTLNWSVDANVSAGVPVIEGVASGLAGSAAQAFLDIEVPEAIG